MTPQEYISSGMLELYALGSASASEMQEVEMMISKYPEVKSALDEICAGLENYATLHAVEPDEKLKGNIFAKISAGKTSTVKSSTTNSEKGKVIALEPEKSSRFKTLAIAASILLVLSVGINYYLWMKANSADERIARVNDLYRIELNNRDTLFSISENNYEKAMHYYDSLHEVLSFMRNPMTQNIALNSIVDGHPMKAVVHWNMKSMEVAVDPMTLPSTSDSTKYVFWAIVNGKPVNEGSFSMNDRMGIQMMKAIPSAEAFAISLEKSSSVETPAGPIYVMGKPTPSQP